MVWPFSKNATDTNGFPIGAEIYSDDELERLHFFFEDCLIPLFWQGLLHPPYNKALQASVIIYNIEVLFQKDREVFRRLCMKAFSMAQEERKPKELKRCADVARAIRLYRAESPRLDETTGRGFYKWVTQEARVQRHEHLLDLKHLEFGRESAEEPEVVRWFSTTLPLLLHKRYNFVMPDPRTIPSV